MAIDFNKFRKINKSGEVSDPEASRPAPYKESLLSLVTMADMQKSGVRKRYIQDRMKVLFDEVEIHDKFSYYKKAGVTSSGKINWERYAPGVSDRFKINTRDFLDKAKKIGRKIPNLPYLLSQAGFIVFTGMMEQMILL